VDADVGGSDVEVVVTEVDGLVGGKFTLLHEVSSIEWLGRHRLFSNLEVGS
jgi:hypothetical protein